MRSMLLASAVAFGCTAAMTAHAAVISTGTAVYSGLGSTLIGPFDQVTLGASNSTINTFPGQVTLNAVTFRAGPNGVSNGTFTGTLADTGRINGALFAYAIPYTLTIGSYLDSVLLGATSFMAGGYQFTTSELTLPAVFTSSGFVGTANLVATITTVPAVVPEPASLALLAGGVAALCVVRRRHPRAA